MAYRIVKDKSRGLVVVPALFCKKARSQTQTTVLESETNDCDVEIEIAKGGLI